MTKSHSFLSPKLDRFPGAMGAFFLGASLCLGTFCGSVYGQESAADAGSVESKEQDSETEPKPTAQVEESDSEHKESETRDSVELTPEQEAMEKERLAELEIRLSTFRKKRDELRELQFAQRSRYIRYVNGINRGPAERDQYYASRIASRTKLNETYDASLDVARVGYDKEALTFLVTWLQNRNNHDIYDLSTYEGSARMIDSGSRFLYLFQAASRSAIVVGEFASAKQLLELIKDENREDVDKALEYHLEKHEEFFLYEKKIREEEADLELPQVRLRTTQGDVVVELYINQAPRTVAHFIGLVEEGFYDDNDFYQVIDHLVALTGDPSGTGDGNCGKFLIDEHEVENARKALRGSLVMAKVPVPDTKGEYYPHSASSQFAISLLPIIQMSEKQTVFGSVVEGMECVCRMRRVDPSKEKKKGEIVFPADRIIEATVIRRPEKLAEPKYVQLPQR